MLTYSFAEDGGPKYLQLAEAIKRDISKGRLKKGDRLPSKRSFARNCGVSTITVQNAYDQLIGEGYVRTEEKKGYFVSIHVSEKPRHLVVEKEMEEPTPLPDISNNRMRKENFPFSVWSRLLRETIRDDRERLLSPIGAEGDAELRKAIAYHLSSFKAMAVSASQIVVGSGTEYLYSLLIKLLGREKIYALEDPGYGKLGKIYGAEGVRKVYVNVDSNGLSSSLLEASGADIAHISPNHHFPTGITMPLERRYELLTWASRKEGRFIIEDDYDSEFRVSRTPVPTLYSMDGSQSVIYMNTFSKSLASSIRISYMVLPYRLRDAFREKLSFYSTTVPSFEQLTLARFINQGYFEKHINRMRLFYTRQRQAVMETIQKSPVSEFCTIKENSSGLHFLLLLHTEVGDNEIKNALKEEGIGISALSDYAETREDSHQFLVNYSNLDLAILEKALLVMGEVMKKERTL